MGMISILDNPFACIEDAKVIKLENNTTVQMLVDDHIDSRYLNMLTVFFNDLKLEEKDWDIVIGDTDIVYLLLRPQGGGSSGKNPWRMALGILVAVAAIKVGGLVSAKMLSSSSKILSSNAQVLGFGAAAAVGVAGTLAINALFPIKNKNYLVDKAMDSPTYQIGSMRNNANLYGAIPIILGKMRVAPMIAAPGYIENNDDGTSQDYYGSYIWSAHNDINISDLRIGEQSLTSYGEDIKIKTEKVHKSGLGLYLGSVVSEDKRLELLCDVPMVETATKPLSSNSKMSLGIDISFPSGLFSLDNKGVTRSATVEVGVNYRSIKDKEVWMTPHEAAVNVGVTSERFSKQQLINNGQSYVYIDLKDRSIKLKRRYDVSAGEYIHLLWRIHSYYDGGYTYKDKRSQEYKDKGFFNSITVVDDPNNIDYVYVNLAKGEIRALGKLFTAANRNALNYTISIDNLDVEQYEVKVWRVTADKIDNNSVVDRTNWNNLKVRWEDSVNNFDGYLTMTELSATASKQLNGQIDTLNGLVQSLGRTYTKAKGWSNDKMATSNPASLLLEVLQGKGNAKRVNNNQVDYVSLGEFYQHCEDNKFEYNRYHDGTMNLQEVLSDIAMAGRAFIGQANGKYCVYIEKAGKSPTQLFNNDNIIKDSFSCSKIIAELPHALRCTFKNEEMDYESDERPVYMDGYKAINADLYETMDFPYVTNTDQIYKMAREYMKAAVLRDEIYTFQVSYDILRSKRRDVISLAHDVLMVGLSYGRIEHVEGNLIYLYDDVQFESGKNYCLEVRSDNSEGYQVKIIAVVATEAGNCVKGDTAGIQAGMLYTFAEVDKESMESKGSMECIITDIIMGEDLTATITAVPYAPDIYSHPDDPIPPHVPNISIPNNKPRVPPKPYFVSFNESLVLAGGEVVTICSINYNIINDTNIMLVQYELQMKKPYNTIWEPLSTNLSNILHSDLKQYEYGRYEFRLRSISDQYVTSAWVYEIRNLLGFLQPIGNVKNLNNRFAADGSSTITWAEVEDFRSIEYVVRRGNSWGSGESIGITNDTLLQVDYSGLYWIKARVVGSKIESALPAKILIEHSDLMVGNVIAEYEEAPQWLGVKAKLDHINGAVLFNASKHYDEGHYGEMVTYYEVPEEHIIKLSSPEACHIVANYNLGISTDYNYYEIANLYDRNNVYSGDDDLHRFNLYTMDNVYGIDSVYGKHSDSFKVTVQIQADDKEWQDFYIGLHHGQTFKLRLKIEIYDRNIDVGIRSFYYSVDVPDRVDTYYNELLVNGKLNLIFNKPFNSPPAVVANILNAEVGDYVMLSQSRLDGVNIEVRNGNNIIKSKTLNIMVQGY